MSTTHLWALIQEWLDAQFFRVSQAQLADKLGVRRSALSQWKLGQARPTPANLRQIHQVTRIDYDRLLDALVRDMGYLDAEEGEGDGNAASNTPAGGSPALGEPKEGGGFASPDGPPAAGASSPDPRARGQEGLA